MRFLILSADYPGFLRWLYGEHPGLEKQAYEEQMRVRNESLFNVPFFYSNNLRKLGHESYDIHANNEFMQRAWLREHKPKVFFQNKNWCYSALKAQIKYYKPDVVLNQAMDFIDHGFLKRMRRNMKLLVGQHAATQLPDSKDYDCYQLVISEYKPTLEYFRDKGVRTAFLRLGFEPEILPCVESYEQSFDITFVGSFFIGIHDPRTALLEAVSIRFPQIKIWGPDAGQLDTDSPIREKYAGQAWGKDMFEILYNSKITLNHHGAIKPYGNNCRMYEATGLRTLLITDWKEDLFETFEPGREVIVYRNTKECIELIEYYLKHDDERKRIAVAGQERTLREHTYFQRMQEFKKLVDELFRRNQI